MDERRDDRERGLEASEELAPPPKADSKPRRRFVLSKFQPGRELVEAVTDVFSDAAAYADD